MSESPWQAPQLAYGDFAQFEREAKRMRAQAVAAMFVAAGRGIRAGLIRWTRQEPTRFAGTLSGRGA